MRGCSTAASRRTRVAVEQESAVEGAPRAQAQGAARRPVVMVRMAAR